MRNVDRRKAENCEEKAGFIQNLFQNYLLYVHRLLPPRQKNQRKLISEMLGTEQAEDIVIQG